MELTFSDHEYLVRTVGLILFTVVKEYFFEGLDLDNRKCVISRLITIYTDCELTSFDALLDKDVISDYIFLCLYELLSIVYLGGLNRATTSIWLHNHRIAYKWVLEFFYMYS